MNFFPNDDWPTVVAGFGSPHGDDQAGWELAALLRRASLPARVVVVVDATQLLARLRSCQRLIIVDACHFSGSAGTITRLLWPDARIAAHHGHSSHGLGVAEMLELAEQLGCLPPLVEVLGIEITDCSPGHDISGKVIQAVTNLAAQLIDELSKVAYA